MPCPVCLFGSVVSLPFASSKTACRSSSRFISDRILRNIPMPLSINMIWVFAAVLATLMKTELPPEWSRALLNISVIQKCQMSITFFGRLPIATETSRDHTRSSSSSGLMAYSFHHSWRDANLYLRYLVLPSGNRVPSATKFLRCLFAACLEMLNWFATRCVMSPAFFSMFVRMNPRTSSPRARTLRWIGTGFRGSSLPSDSTAAIVNLLFTHCQP